MVGMLCVVFLCVVMQCSIMEFSACCCPSASLCVCPREWGGCTAFVPLTLHNTFPSLSDDVLLSRKQERLSALNTSTGRLPRCLKGPFRKRVYCYSPSLSLSFW